MATVYFNNAVSTAYDVAGNYWTDAGCTAALGGVPNWAVDTVHVLSAKTMAVPDSHTLALSGTAVLIVDVGGTLQVEDGGTVTLATGSALTINGAATNCGTLTAASGSTVTIASGKQLVCINGSTTTLAGTLAGSGSVYPHMGATVTVAGMLIVAGPSVAPTADKISVALEFASQIQSATARLPAHQSTGDYSISTLAAERAALITSQATAAATAYKARSGDTTALATLTAEMETLICDSVLIASQAEVLVDNAAAVLLA